MKRRGATLALGLALVLTLSGTALAAPKTPFGHQGRWITDAEGRVVVLHGVNLVAKGAPHLPSERGFGSDDADLLVSEGFNTVRLGIDYAAIEPEPGAYDEAFIDAYARELSLLARRGLFPLADLHQDFFSERYGGNGMPDWMVVDDGLPSIDAGFPLSYLSNPALNRSFDNFWENAAAPDGRPLQSHYAEGLTRLAARMRDVEGLLGYDIFNEPWPGSRYATCVSPVLEGCPPAIGFDQTLLTDFSRRMIAAVRDRDRRHLVFYEPSLLFDFGARTGHGDPRDPRAGFSFHIYCLAWLIDQGAGSGGSSESGCATQEQHAFDNAERHTRETGSAIPRFSEPTGSALLMTEFGSSNDPAAIERMVEAADRNRVGWQYWAYANLLPGERQLEVGSVIRDLRRPPTADNLKQDVLDVLVRAYPRVVAGTPSTWEFDREARRFRLSYSTKGPGGEDFAGGGGRSPGHTEIHVPSRHFGRDYRVTATGAQAVSRRDGGQILILRNCRGASEVEVEITDEDRETSAGCGPGS